MRLHGGASLDHETGNVNLSRIFWPENATPAGCRQADNDPLGVFHSGTCLRNRVHGLPELRQHIKIIERVTYVSLPWPNHGWLDSCA